MKLAVVVTDNVSTWHFRRELLRSAVKRGIETTVITSSGPHDQQLRDLGVTLVTVPVSRTLHPIKDIGFTKALYKTFRRDRFDIVHNISIKPNIYGALAARLAAVPTVVGSVTGRGNVFMDESGRLMRLLRPWIFRLYGFAFKLTDRVWFQNQDDVELFVTSNMLDRLKAVLIRSSGVNLREDHPSQIDPSVKQSLRESFGVNSSTILVTMVARTLWSKGITEFLEAAAIITAKHPEVKFLLVGSGEKGNPQTVPAEYLESRVSPNLLWLGWRNDVREILSISDIAVLLSYTAEGVPRSMLEAMAMIKPIITTDVVGCREVVDPGVNGILIPPRSFEALVAALEELINDPEKRFGFGAASRRKVEQEFDQDVVNHRIITELYRA